MEIAWNTDGNKAELQVNKNGVHDAQNGNPIIQRFSTEGLQDFVQLVFLYS